MVHKLMPKISINIFCRTIHWFVTVMRELKYLKAKTAQKKKELFKIISLGFVLSGLMKRSNLRL